MALIENPILSQALWVSPETNPHPVKPERFQPQALSEIAWLGGKEEQVAVFPILNGLPVSAGFSWGAQAYNLMLSSQALQQLQDGSPRKTEATIKYLLGSTQLLKVESRPIDTVRIAPHMKRGKPNNQPEVLEITDGIMEKHREDVLEHFEDSDFPQNLATGADFVFTRMTGVALVVMPADCPSAVIYAKDKYGRDIVGVSHWGRDEVENLSPAKTIACLRAEGCAAKDIIVALSPGISKDNYFIQQRDVDRLLPNLGRWGDRAEPRRVVERARWGDEEERVYLDLAGRITDQVQDFLVPGSNIEIYNVDTYEAAKKGIAPSFRFATTHKSPSRDGRIIITAQLA
ncbi:MAG: laccase domain-containing protein [Candidatus Levyibacteriota bacterium]